MIGNEVMGNQVMGPSQAVLSMDSTNYNQLNLNGGLSVSTPINYSANSLPCFKMINGATGQALATATGIIITFGGTLWNLGGGTITNTAYYAAMPGYYHLSAAIAYSTNKTTTYLAFRVNGTTRTSGFSSGTAAVEGCGMNSIVYLNAGDYVELYYDNGGGINSSATTVYPTTSVTDSRTWFCGFWIRN